LPSAPALILRFSHDNRLVRDLAAAWVDDTAAVAIDEAGDREWRVFYSNAAARGAARAVLEPSCRAHGISLDDLDVHDEDWARRSQAQLKAVRVGKIVVAPPWDTPTSTAGEDSPTVIVIEPSAGFGTGHHASTRLSILALQRLDLAGRSVIDVGTGSGVLAIAAAKLGAARVTGIDTDPDAIGSALDNVGRNSVNVELRVADVASFDGTFDVVLANLTAAWLRRLAAQLLALSPNGRFVLAGLQTTEKAAVLTAFSGSTDVIDDLEEEGWSALIFAR
jgi:ribosomal protein L11 methyltransferase